MKSKKIDRVLLERFLEEGVARKEMARRFGCSKQLLYQYMNANGIRYDRLVAAHAKPMVDRQWLRKQLSSGRSDADIAGEAGVRRDTIRDIRRGMKIRKDARGRIIKEGA